MAFGIGFDGTIVKRYLYFCRNVISDKYLQSDGSPKKFNILIVNVFLDFNSA